MILLNKEHKNIMKNPYTKLTPIERSQKPIDPRVDIGHVHMKTSDIQKMHDFYVSILGFDVIAKMDSALFLSAGGYHHNLAFNTWESAGGRPPAAGTTGLYHIAIRYPDKPSLGDALQRLVTANYPLIGTNDHGTHIALYLSDPDQNGLELYYDKPESEWPVDENGHLLFHRGGHVDLDDLLKSAR